ncbi:hypothetical protein [Methanobrevibacter sp. DSM 116169]|uniref:hypothetical protein n=1 Tax=Methanobrevibacter sp. DSM 116169 TaxID=3242727 RepID=UPI0038FCCF16
MNYLFIPLFYALSGFLMKYSDDEYDENHNKLSSVILGILCGLITAVVCFLNSDAACIFIAILLGNLIAFKIDGIHHIATLITFIIVLIFLGIPNISLIPLIISLIAAFIDELGNDNEKLYSKSKYLKFFFDYRFTMKIAILILAIFSFLKIESFVFFILFELSYELAGYIFLKLNN